MNPIKLKSTEGFCSELAKRARQGKMLALALSLTATTIYAQGSGTPNQLRVKTDANGYLLVAGLAQTNPVSQTVFSQTRLKTDANGSLLVVFTGGTSTSPIFGPTESSCATVAYSFTSRTTTGLNSHAANTWNLCGGGTLGLSGNTTGVTVSLPLLIAAGSVTAPSLAIASETGVGFYDGGTSNIALAANVLKFTKSGYSNGLASDYYGLLKIDDWTTPNSGLELRATMLQSTTPAGPALDVNAWSPNSTTYSNISLNASTTSGSSLDFVGAGKHLLNICNNLGNTPCDFKIWDVVGEGAITQNVLDIPNSSHGFGTTSKVGYNLQNGFSATATDLTEWSPAFTWCGSARKTNATAGTQIDCFKAENKTLTGAAVTTASWVLSSSINAAAYSAVLTVTDTGITSSPTINATTALQQNGVAAALGVAANYKIARGSTALDGSNPTTVATGLSTVVSCTGTLLRNSALTSGTAFLTHDTASGANVDWYGWVIAGTASSGTETFEWVCVGT